ncbi:DUF1330 domain-containing protein [Nitrospirillum sp. BR 11752]|uniref:Uncharacterized protein (DUF1330 family) n=1 Tax=Nitrospirillum amazonense TaxID=28077 RepID=A0A560HKM2_9PROT|nr:DUF1330 domain-containing protein [Nitrospirillum amazonense]MEE3623523.1 DUF1330 domain-containing protein [Nitrospirillum sp. BR 11752]TWB45904.1 uncharacterized protein (DUF1330 family) [Nitrospirillum amazonense]
MPAHIVATIRITDPARFAPYLKGIAGLAEAHGGEYLVRAKVDEVVEGAVDPEERVVVIRFPTVEAARAYVHSDTYRAAAALRQGAGTVETRLLADPA